MIKQEKILGIYPETLDFEGDCVKSFDVQICTDKNDYYLECCAFCERVDDDYSNTQELTNRHVEVFSGHKINNESKMSDLDYEELSKLEFILTNKIEML